MMTKAESPLDMRALDELHASVGEDPVFVAELIDDFVEEAPRQLEILREAATSGEASRPDERRHAKGQRPRSEPRARLAV